MLDMFVIFARDVVMRVSPGQMVGCAMMLERV